MFTAAVRKGAIVLTLMLLADIAVAAAGLLSWRIVVVGVMIAAFEALKIVVVLKRFSGSGSNKEGMATMGVEVGTFLLAIAFLFVVANPTDPENKMLAVAYCINFMVARVGGFLVIQDKLS